MREFGTTRDRLANLPRELREKQTRAEEYLWRVLRDRRFRGLKFRRQHRVTNFIADFYCHSLKLIIELDGEVHSTASQAAHDENRDTYLEYLGYSIIRIPNQDIFQDLAAVMARLSKLVDELESRQTRG